MMPIPKVIKRKCGGYLAVAPRGARFGIGVTGDTEQEAHFLFIQAYRQWTETLDGPWATPEWALGLEWGPL